MARFTVTPAVYVVLHKDGKILLLRRANTGYQDGMYALPAGHIDGAEPALQAAIREAREEIGVMIDPTDMHFVHVMHRLAEEGDHERVDFFFEATKWQGEPQNMEPNKCDDVSWFPVGELPANISPVTLLALQQVATGGVYSHHNFEGTN